MAAQFHVAGLRAGISRSQWRRAQKQHTAVCYRLMKEKLVALCRAVPPGAILSSDGDLEDFREQLHCDDKVLAIARQPQEKVRLVLDHLVAHWAVAEDLRGGGIDLPMIIKEIL